MRQAFTWASILILVVSYTVACSPVKFSAKPKDSITPRDCTESGSNCIYNYQEVIKGPKVDILFVNDNSASMSFEQRALANRFSGFIQHLDSKGVEYRIGITTTDIQQNGNLISFGSGMNYLTPSVGDRVTRFNSTIVRPETLQCEQFIANYVAQYGTAGTNTADYQEKYKQNCPTPDERGIYAANLTVTNNPSAFMRDDAYLAIIFLADEDERSGLYCYGPNNPNCVQTGFPLEAKDQPINLFNAFKARGKLDEQVEVHSIIVPPGDSSCLSQQNNQTLGNPAVSATTGMVRGSPGSLYHTFTTAGWGDTISICLNNYATSLETLADKIGSNKGIILECENPQELTVTPNLTYTLAGRTLTFNPKPTPGTTVQLSYKCPLF